MKKILAISGSLRAGSSNHAILKHLGSILPGNIAYQTYDGIAHIPHFDPGLDNDEPPVAVSSFRTAIAEADGIIICTPEYAYGVPGSLKNALDWTVSSGSLVDKPLLLITAATGGQNAHAALSLILGALSANLLTDAALLISFVRSKINLEGNIMDEGTAGKLGIALDKLLTSIV